MLLALAWISFAAVGSDLPADRAPVDDRPALLTAEPASPRPAHPRLGLAVSAAALATLTATAASIGAGWILPSACFDAFGRPDPWCSAGGFALGTGVQLGLSMLVPEVFWLAGGGTRESIASARLGLWQHARWAALVAAVFVVLYGVGAGLEHVDYGRGQPSRRPRSTRAPAPARPRGGAAPRVLPVPAPEDEAATLKATQQAPAPVADVPASEVEQPRRGKRPRVDVRVRLRCSATRSAVTSGSARAVGGGAWWRW